MRSAEGYRRLAAAILVQAAVDLREDPESWRYQSAVRFIRSAWFESLCFFLDIDPGWARRKLFRGARQRRVLEAVDRLWNATSAVIR